MSSIWGSCEQYLQRAVQFQWQIHQLQTILLADKIIFASHVINRGLCWQTIQSHCKFLHCKYIGSSYHEANARLSDTKYVHRVLCSGGEHLCRIHKLATFTISYSSVRFIERMYQRSCNGVIVYGVTCVSVLAWLGHTTMASFVRHVSAPSTSTRGIGAF